MRLRLLLCFLLIALVQAPAHTDTILQAFWWDCQNESFYAPGKTYEYEWYNYIRAQLPRFEAVGITGLWTPPLCKSASSTGYSMGYDVFDHYDLGEKLVNQPPSKPDGRTRFGTRDEFLRFVASAHAHGIGVYPDIVLNHMAGGKKDAAAPSVDANGHRSDDLWKRFRYSAAGGPEAGRWPKGWWNFHPNPDHNSINSNDIDAEMWGPDICYASNHDAEGRPSEKYMLRQAVEWFEWLSRVTGVDGYRFDAVRHYEPYVVRDVLAREEAVRGRKPFAVVEYGTWDTADLDRWIGQTEGRARTFDFPLHDQLVKMVLARGMYNIGSLPDFLQKDGAHSVPFVNSHDTVRGPAGNYMTIPPDDPWAGLAYAYILSLDRTPCVFYEDLFPNRSVQLRRYGNPETRPMRQWLADLIKIRERYASGSEPVKYPLRTNELLVIERPGKMVTILNNNGADWREAKFTSSFGPGVELRDITGQSDARVRTGTGADAGKVSFWLPAASYAVLVKASEPALSNMKRAPEKTVQEIEFADDLSTGCLGNAVRTFKIWPAADSEIDAELKLEQPAKAAVELLSPDGKLCKPLQRFDGRQGAWKSTSAGWYTFRIKVPGKKQAHAFLKVSYTGAR